MVSCGGETVQEDEDIKARELEASAEPTTPRPTPRLTNCSF
jgi:hypothetical protein